MTSTERTRANVARARRVLTMSPNRLIVEFMREWDGSLDDVDRFRDSLAYRGEPASIRDHAADLLEDLRDAMRADA